MTLVERRLSSKKSLWLLPFSNLRDHHRQNSRRVVLQWTAVNQTKSLYFVGFNQQNLSCGSNVFKQSSEIKVLNAIGLSFVWLTAVCCKERVVNFVCGGRIVLKMPVMLSLHWHTLELTYWWSSIRSSAF